jgi:hypothetical protein
MASTLPQPERRRDPRISPKGTALVRTEDDVFPARIANLSRNGVALATTGRTHEHLLGVRVRLSLRLDDGGSTWFELDGDVLRIGTDSLVLAIVEAPSAFTRDLDEAVTRSLRHDRTLSVVLVDATARRREAMAEAFRDAGCNVVEVATPLEAIVRLGESHFEPDLIAIADSQPATISDEMRRFVAAAHPGARLVTIGDTATGPDGLVRWLSSENPNADLAARIRRVLTTFGA